MSDAEVFDSESITSRATLAGFINHLRHDLNSDPTRWENTTQESFLEALAAFLEDVPGFGG